MKKGRIYCVLLFCLIIKSETIFGMLNTYRPVTKVTANNVKLVDTILNVKSFGALGNGISDDTKAIDAALNAAGNKLKLFFPQGTYIINKAFSVKTGIIGAGEDKTTIRLTNYSTIDLDSWIFTIAADNVLLSKFTLDGNRLKNLGTPVKGIGGIRGNNIRHLTIKNVSINNVRAIGLLLENFPNSILSFINVSNCGRFGQDVEKGYQADRLGILLMNKLKPGNPYYCGKDVTVNNIKITGAGMDGLSSSVGTYYYKVVGNHCGAEMSRRDPGAAGIYFRSESYVDEVTFDHCEGNYNTGIGIDIGNLPNLSKPVFKNVKIINCLASYNYLNGIGIAGCQYGLVKNCVAWNNGQLLNLFSGSVNHRRAGIAINGNEKVETSNITIEDNKCYDDQKVKTQTYGMFIGTQFIKGGGTAANYSIKDNDFRNNKFVDGIERSIGQEGAEVVSKGFLSVQNNMGITLSTDTATDGAEISPITPVINLKAVKAVSIKGIKQGLPGDKVTLKNTSLYSISLVGSNKFLLPGNNEMHLNSNQSVTFKCIDGFKWKLFANTPEKKVNH